MEQMGSSCVPQMPSFRRSFPRSCCWGFSGGVQLLVFPPAPGHQHPAGCSKEAGAPLYLPKLLLHSSQKAEQGAKGGTWVSCGLPAPCQNYYEMFTDCRGRALHAELKQQPAWPGVSNPQYFSSCQNGFFFSPGRHSAAALEQPKGFLNLGPISGGPAMHTKPSVFTGSPKHGRLLHPALPDISQQEHRVGCM